VKYFLVAFLLILFLGTPAFALETDIDQVLKDQPPGWYIISSFHGEAVSYSYNEHSDVVFSGRAYENIYWIPDQSTPYLISKVDDYDHDFSGSPQNYAYFFERWKFWSQYTAYTFGYSENGQDKTFHLSSQFGSLPGTVFEMKSKDFSSNPINYDFSAPYYRNPFPYRYILLDDYKLVKKDCNDFVGCISQKFSQKFPFDILVNLPSWSSSCPQIEFFGFDYELCWLDDLMRILKYPIGFSLIFKLYRFL